MQLQGLKTKFFLFIGLIGVLLSSLSCKKSTPNPDTVQNPNPSYRSLSDSLHSIAVEKNFFSYPQKTLISNNSAVVLLRYQELPTGIMKNKILSVDLVKQTTQTIKSPDKIFDFDLMISPDKIQNTIVQLGAVKTEQLDTNGNPLFAPAIFYDGVFKFFVDDSKISETGVYDESGNLIKSPFPPRRNLLFPLSLILCGLKLQIILF